MAKAKNGNKAITVKVLIWLFSIVFAAGVLWAATNANSTAINEHKTVDDARDKEAIEETDKLENSIIAIEKDIGYINKGMAEQKVLSKERHTEIIKKIESIHRSP